MNKNAAKVLDKLTADLPVGKTRKIDNTNGVFMPVHVEHLTPTLYSVAHYYQANGDLVPDPDGEFYRDSEGGWHAVGLQMSTGYYTRVIELGADGQPARVNPRAKKEVESFVAMWMRNIKQQQGL